jgi:hypothetical protein
MGMSDTATYRMRTFQLAEVIDPPAFPTTIQIYAAKPVEMDTVAMTVQMKMCGAEHKVETELTSDDVGSYQALAMALATRALPLFDSKVVPTGKFLIYVSLQRGDQIVWDDETLEFSLGQIARRGLVVVILRKADVKKLLAKKTTPKIPSEFRDFLAADDLPTPADPLPDGPEMLLQRMSMARDDRLTQLREVEDRMEFHGVALAQGMLRAYAETAQVAFAAAARIVPADQTSLMIAENNAEFFIGLDRAFTTISPIAGPLVMDLFRERSIAIEIQGEVLRASSPTAGGRRPGFLQIVESLILNIYECPVYEEQAGSEADPPGRADPGDAEAPPDAAGPPDQAPYSDGFEPSDAFEASEGSNGSAYSDDAECDSE